MADRLMRADLAADDAPPKIDTTVAHIARVYDYWLGGVRQFLDIGTGLPSANNTHEVAQAAAPAARVVYVDNEWRPDSAEESAAPGVLWAGVAGKP